MVWRPGNATDLPICCLLDARKQQVYAAFYRYEEERLPPDQPFSCLGAGRACAPNRRADPDDRARRPGRASICSTAHPLMRLTPAGFLQPRAARSVCAAPGCWRKRMLASLRRVPLSMSGRPRRKSICGQVGGPGADDHTENNPARFMSVQWPSAAMRPLRSSR